MGDLDALLALQFVPPLVVELEGRALLCSPQPLQMTTVAGSSWGVTLRLW